MHDKLSLVTVEGESSGRDSLKQIIAFNFVFFFAYGFQEWSEIMYSRGKDMATSLFKQNSDFWREVVGFMLSLVMLFMYGHCETWIYDDKNYAKKMEWLTDFYSKSFYSHTVLVPLTLLIHWVRALQVLKLSQSLTPFLKIVWLMLYDVIRFLFVTGIIFFSFCAGFYILFNNIEGYNTLPLTIETLFGAMLGNINTDFMGQDI